MFLLKLILFENNLFERYLNVIFIYLLIIIENYVKRFILINIEYFYQKN